MIDGPETSPLEGSPDAEADGPTLSSELQRKITELGQGYLSELRSGGSPDRGAIVSAHPEVSPFLEQHLQALEAMHRAGRPDAPGAAPKPAAGLVPERIGPYRIIEALGEGGMGSVYLAEQIEPVRRRVALKLIKLGMDTKEVVARFESERQALALMDHPSIARVYDAGATEAGRPYFVMELVRGIPITEYCDRNRLSTTARLRLFRAVCEAVQHAHQKGIIHRDLKPSNVLVTDLERKPAPKIIDFGVARATNQKLTEQTLFTLQGELVGTPEYMSPEQADMTGLDIDTRTDIYSLGVILYELLAGSLPFEAKDLRKSGLDEIRRVIREEEPPRPSTRASTLGERRGEVARRRGTEPRGLVRQLRGDLDWITMRALEKDRSRRYSSASELSADIERHLSDEPVLAGPPGAAYRTGKFLRKYREHVVGVVALFAVLVTGLGVSLAQKGEARRNAREAEKARRLADRALEREYDQRVAAERQAEKAAAIGGFLGRMFTAIEPERLRGDRAMADLLAQAEADLDEAFPEDPEIEASIRMFLGTSNEAMGIPDRARRHLERALAIRLELLGPDDPETLDARHALGRLLFAWPDATSFAESRARAERLLREALDGRTRVLGAEHPDTLAASDGLAEALRGPAPIEAESLLRRALDIRERTLGRHHRDTIRTLAALGRHAQDDGRLDEALALQVETLGRCRTAHGEDAPETTAAKRRLAGLLERTGETGPAEVLVRQVAAAARSRYGADSPEDLRARIDLAGFLHRNGRAFDAERTWREILDMSGPVLDRAGLRRAEVVDRLVDLLAEQERHDEAEAALREQLRRSVETYGQAHAESLAARYALADRLRARGAVDEAESLRQEALRIARDLHGPESDEALLATKSLGDFLVSVGRPADAEPHYRDALHGYRNRDGEETYWVWHAGRALADILLSQDRYEEAERLVSGRALAEAYTARGHDLVAAGDPAGAIRVLERLVRVAPDHATGHYNLACAYALSGKGEEALDSLARAVEAGWRDVEHLRADPDLETVRGDARFREILEAAGAATDGSAD